MNSIIKKAWAGVRIGMVVGLCVAGAVSISEQLAHAIPPFHILQAPVYIQRGTTVLAAFYEDGGSSVQITTAGKGVFDPLTGGITNVTRSLSVDGGSSFKAVAATSAVVTGAASIDGGLGVGNGIDVSTGGLTLETGGGLAYATKPMVPLITAAAVGDNSMQCYIGAVGTPITFAPAFSSGTPHGWCNDLTASQFARTTATSTTGTITGTGTDSVFCCYLGIK